MSETQPTGAQPDNLHDGQNTAESAFMSGLKELRNDSSKSARDIAEGLSELYGHDDFKSWSDEDLYKFIAEANENRHEQTDGPSVYAQYSAEQKADFMKVLTPMVQAFEDRVANSSDDEYQKSRKELQDALTREGGITRAEAYALIELARDDIYGVGQDVAPAEKADGAEADPKADEQSAKAEHEVSQEDLGRFGKMRAWVRNKILGARGAGMAAGIEMRQKRSEFYNGVQREDGESEADFNKHHKKFTRVAMGAASLVALGVTAYYVTKGFGGLPGGASHDLINSHDPGKSPEPVAAPGVTPVDNEIHHNVAGMSPHEIYEFGANSRQEQSKWLLENGRTGNDFNNIDVALTKDETINKLATQYNRAPNELAAQMFQIQEVESGNKDMIAKIPEDYRIREGETMEQYSARVGDFLHADGETKDKFAHLTTEYIKTHYNVQDMPSHYQSAYIDANGVVQWDTEVTKADPNDKIIMLGKDTGIRLPCGQPVKILPEEVVAPTPQYEQATSQPVQQQYVAPRGQGGGTTTYEQPVKPGKPGTPVTPETPTVPVTPTEPETPVVPPAKPDKDTSRTHDLSGLTADTRETEQTQDPDTAGNGTASPDATTTTETTPTTTQDTGTNVTVPGTNTETNANTGNAPEPGANAPDNSKNGGFDASNL